MKSAPSFSSAAAVKFPQSADPADAAHQSKSGSAAVPSNEGLPPDDEPLAEAFSELSRLAKQGNRVASCSLAVELSRCMTAKKALEGAQQVLDSSGDPKINAAIAERFADAGEEYGALCAGVTPEMYAQAYRFQAMAADGGNRAQAQWLVTAPQLDEKDFLNHLDEWADYKRRADIFWQSVLAQQHRDDLTNLLNVYAPVGSAPVPQPYNVSDNVTFLALLEIARQRGQHLPHYMDAAEANARQALTPEGQSAVSKRIAQLDKGFRDAGHSSFTPDFNPDQHPRNAQEICRQQFSRR